MKNILITGGCGFIGANLIQELLNETDWKITVLDSLTYASRGFARLKYIGAMNNNNRVHVRPCDVSYPSVVTLGAEELGPIDYIVHLAAEVNVDRSIASPELVVRNNVMGTLHMLQLARVLWPIRFLNFSTDEVFGPALSPFSERARHNPTNPYSASKSAGEGLAHAWANTYGVPLINTHCTNVFGRMANPECFIPLTVKRLLNNEKIVIHCSDKGESSSRVYTYVRDVASAIIFLLKKEALGTFNIAGGRERRNIDVAEQIAGILHKPFNPEKVNFPVERPGFDLGYLLDSSKLRKLGWADRWGHEPGFEHVLQNTVCWYSANKEWLEKFGDL